MFASQVNFQANGSLAMQTTSDKTAGTAANPGTTEPRHGSGGAVSATELGRHYGEHGHPATTNAGPSPEATRGGEQIGASASSATETARDIMHRAGEQAASAVAKAGETAQDWADRAREQAAPTIAKITETTHDLAKRAREQAAPAAQAVYDQSARAGEYVARNINQYPITALLIAAAIGYGIAYLIHGGTRDREGW
jgi:ElaB/YqjD/DUF883 family membrane-anchored ribosome-binding protein